MALLPKVRWMDVPASPARAGHRRWRGMARGLAASFCSALDMTAAAGSGGRPTIWRATRRTASFNRANGLRDINDFHDLFSGSGNGLLAVLLDKGGELISDFVQGHIAVAEELHQFRHVPAEVKPNVERCLPLLAFFLASGDGGDSSTESTRRSLYLRYCRVKAIRGSGKSKHLAVRSGFHGLLRTWTL